MNAVKKPIRKAVFPVAGLGTRFLPSHQSCTQGDVDGRRSASSSNMSLTRHAPPASSISFSSLEGIRGVIEDHFDKQFELEIDARRTRQKEGDRSSHTRSSAGRSNELYEAAVASGPWPRRLVRARTRRQRALCAALARHAASRPLVMPRRYDQRLLQDRRQSDRSRTRARGSDPSVRIVGVKDVKAKVSTITEMIEKRSPGTAPSNLHITGRYVLQPKYSISSKSRNAEPAARFS